MRICSKIVEWSQMELEMPDDVGLGFGFRRIGWKLPKLRVGIYNEVETPLNLIS